MMLGKIPKVVFFDMDHTVIAIDCDVVYNYEEIASVVVNPRNETLSSVAKSYHWSVKNWTLK